MEPRKLALPPNMVGHTDVSRVIRELGNLKDFFVGAEVRPSGTPIQPPRLSRMLDQLARGNKFNLLDAAQRDELLNRLNVLQKSAPQMHISFAAEPSPQALEPILLWLRQNIHPQVLLQVGLQPKIAAGCVLRTPNKVFDMSMRNFLEKQQPYMVELINEAARGR